MNKIRVLYKTPYGEVERLTVENTLEAFQALVGGYIECVYWPAGPHGERRVLVVNEVGKLINMDRNFVRLGSHDWIYGPAVWVGDDGSGEFVDVDPELYAEIQDVAEWSHVDVALYDLLADWDPQDALAALLNMYDGGPDDDDSDE